MGEWEANKDARSLSVVDHGRFPTKTSVPVELSRSARSMRMINRLQEALRRDGDAKLTSQSDDIITIVESHFFYSDTYYKKLRVNE